MVNGTPGLGAAFADFPPIRRQSGSYAAFFAFRVLENIAYTFPRDTRKASLADMNYEGYLGAER